MAVRKFYTTIIIALILAAGCVEPFDFPVNDEDVGFLVVNGFINTSNQTTTVALSRAIPLAASDEFPLELNASVSIEEDGAGRYDLLNGKNGVYTLTHPDFVNGKRYRLHIVTASGNEYYSEYITTKSTPEIDSLSWTPSPEGITIKLDTDDPTSKTKYYRWEYTESWRYEAEFSSEYKLVNGTVVARTEQEVLKTCYANQPSAEIITNSTIGFMTDRFIDQEIAFIPALSPKIRLHYSILVRQFALSEQAYAYWQQLDINTESLGGLFDPQPSQLRGNITRADDSNEPVIGFFDGGSVAEKRLFIHYSELPDYLQVIIPNPNCIQELIPVDSVHTLDAFHLITHSVYWGPVLVGYNSTSQDCADCRRQGGVLEKPSFWPN
jgi:hypothetical protein